jgi:polyisoprenoid-binding protein YceI
MTEQVTGRTATSDGWPLPGATVTLIGPDGRQIGRATADATGRFSVPADATGPATLIVAAAGLDPVARSVPLPGHDLGTIVLQAAGHDRLPSPGTWTIDPAHSIVRATARHLGMSRVEGRFTELASIDTGSRDRDTHLRSPDFLDVKQFPTLRYRSSGLTRLSDDHWQLDGGLTIRDITRPVALDVHYGGSGPDPWGGTRMAAKATTQLHRSDYDINWNMGLPGGLTLIGPTLRIELDIQAVLGQ